MNGALLPKSVLDDSNSFIEPMRKTSDGHGAVADRPVRALYRSAIGLTLRRLAPVKSCRGRPILYSGSDTISFNCAIQPAVRARAKIAVNSCTGMLIGFCTMP